MRLASWPGREHEGNDVIAVLLDALQRRGVIVHDVSGRVHAPPDGVDVVLLHWAERPFWGEPNPARMAIRAVRTLRELDRLRRHTKLLWMVHNLRPHDGGWPLRLMWPFYASRFARRVDAWIALSPGTVAPVCAAFPELADKPGGYVWHPRYPMEQATPAERVATRAAYGFDPATTVIGYCGKIRGYKGVESLADAFIAWPNESARLLLAGEAREPRLAGKLERRAAADTRIRLDLRAMSGAEFSRALLVPDLIVAPFRDYLHSGSIVHALSAGQRVLTPATPFAESLRAVAPNRVETYHGVLTAERLAAAAAMPPAADMDLEALSPDTVADSFIAFCRKELGIRA